MCEIVVTWMTYLVSMQTAHTSFDFCGVYLLDTASKRCLNKHAAKQTDHAGCVQEGVPLISRHEVFNTSSKMISPGSVLMRHMLLFRRILFSTLEEALCSDCQYLQLKQNMIKVYLLAVTFLFSRSTSSWKPKTRTSGGFCEEK